MWGGLDLKRVRKEHVYKPGKWPWVQPPISARILINFTLLSSLFISCVYRAEAGRAGVNRTSVSTLSRL